ncbi:phosphate/phosphite/phosphonate ABC transporter substrate-binding protein [Cupriavidus sp. D39]|uniref:phosphate/phosphite/phosphonate ABC transporter substrate-binding protein n=1 Tax=Cupriavidus sp. D39 TaxID=2997877 RepID=UPI00226F5F6B|nr:PhnD/SsuA/transferrin family substrate-binding protein [Cupriavidus sp. D39]MCY0854149.1 PhnD/SsuA/transferrin family substrate-binding protein [Cupriavidus sp. D39]
MHERKHWVAALPMYNLTPALHVDWLTLIARVAEVLARQPDPISLSAVEPAGTAEALHDFWRRPDLLLSQTCGYPLVQGLRRHVRIIGTPLFNAPGCDGTSYTSAIVARAEAGPATLAACHGLRAAYNDACSHSGMNALRYAVAPLARGGRFFSETLCTGSHLASLDAVTSGAADVAAIDCVTLAFARDHLPGRLAALRQIASTEAAPGLPLVSSRQASPALSAHVGAVLAQVIASEPALARRLRLRGFARTDLAHYEPVALMARAALAAGYARLA